MATEEKTDDEFSEEMDDLMADADGDTDSSIPDLLDEEELDDALDDEADTVQETDLDFEDDVVNEPASAGEAMRLTADIPVQLVAVVGKQSISMQDLLNLHDGEVVELGKPVSTVVDLVANGKLFAKGELVEIDGKLGVKIVQVVK
jgi:flagellar motor switch protein FliN